MCWKCPVHQFVGEESEKAKVGFEEACTSLLGGKGLGASFLYELTLPKIEPYYPENVLAIAADLFVETPFPTGCRFVAVTKSRAHFEMYLDKYYSLRG